MPQPIFDKDVETLLQEKIAYHKEQARLHLKMANDTKEKLKLLTTNSSYSIVTHLPDIFSNQTPLGMQGTLDKMPQKLDDFIDVSKKFQILLLDKDFSVTKWKPRVEKVLRESDLFFTTQGILRTIDERYLDDENIRKQAIGAVSSSLFALVEKKLVEKMNNEEGRGNIYRWIK